MHGQPTHAPALAAPGATRDGRSRKRVNVPPHVPTPARPPEAVASAVTMIPCDLTTLLRQFEEVAYQAATRAFKEQTEHSDRMFDNAAAARWFYGDDQRAPHRWRSLRHYNDWIDTLSVGAARQRRWTLASLKEVAARLGRGPAAEDAAG